MTFAELVSELSQVSNGLTLIGVVVAVGTAGLAWLFFHVPRRIQVIAQASMPILWLDPKKLPFAVKVTNTNTRPVKIRKIGFETKGKRSGSYELTLDANLLKTQQLLVAEADETEVTFDGFSIAEGIARGLQGFNLPLDVKTLSIWLYITHGRRIEVAVAPNLALRIIERVNDISAT